MSGSRNDLAGYLSTVWADLPQVEGPETDAAVGSADPDVDRAIALELRQLFADDPALLHDYEHPHARHKRELERDLRLRLSAADEHSVAALLALLGGSPRPVRARTRLALLVARAGQWLNEGDGWLARSLVALWMNVLVAVPVLLVALLLWGDPWRHTPTQTALALLRVFAVWCLSFLPGWLYVRFLGQRAGALWTEFVLHLHRLGWDSPQFLPRPPRASQFHEVWKQAGGPNQDHRHSIYRQKFDAFYGRAVAAGAQQTAFTVRTDSMFPVFLATALFAVCWTSVLWDPGFVVEPSSVWDVLRFAFLGAYAFVVQSLVRRFFQSDLRPSAYASAVLRLVFVLLTMAALHQLLHGTDARTEAGIAFVVGFFPVIALQALQRMVATFLRVFIQQITPDYPLNQLDGLNIWYESRLLEEGIEDMQSLVTANMIDVVLHTRVPVGRLVDWVDQALLYLHLDRVEGGVLEKREVHRGRRAVVRQALREMAAPAAEGSARASVRGAEHVRVAGSVNPALRAGSRTRVALRQLGIRTASDLLVAFPSDGGCGPAAGDPDQPLPSGLDNEQIRVLARVLGRDPGMAVIWNWRAGGPDVAPGALPSR